jgi:hypothetical protein
MKMRKILPLVILAAVAVFSLTSCDALLDAIFQKNQITVDVQINTLTHTWFSYESVTVTLIDTNTGETWVDSQGWGSYNGISHVADYYFSSFRNLPNDTFQVYASYPGSYGDIPATNGYNFYDPQTGLLTTQITMPRANPGDSTGHSANLVTPVF